MKKHLFAFGLLLSLTVSINGGALVAQDHKLDDVKITPLFAKDLPQLPAGKEITAISVEYAPGSVDPIHTHNAEAVLYVLQGSIVMQVKGGPLTTLKAGDTFYEGPNDVHIVGKNASKTEPAKFVVFFVKDKGAPILTPVK